MTEIGLKEFNPPKSKTEVGKKRKQIDGDGSTASPISSALGISNDKSDAVINNINYNPPVLSTLCRPEDLRVTVSDLDQIFNTDDEFDPTMDQVELIL